MQRLSIQSKLSTQFNLTPAFSKSVQNINVADPKVVRALVALMDMEAVLGGAASHFGGPAALAEINSVLYALAFQKGEKWAEHFNLVNDAGHCENGLYALKALYEFSGLNFKDLKKFRSMESSLTGHGEAHVFPEGVLLSNGPLGSSVAQAQGLAMADKLAGMQRTTVVTLSDGGAMEGEAREALASIPGLAAKGKMNPFVLVISDNNTKLSGRIDEDSFSMAPTFKALDPLGWTVIKDIDGHDLEKVFSAFEKAFKEASENPSRPIALHFKTIKGKGHRASEDSASGGHGFPLKSPEGLREMVTEILHSSALLGQDSQDQALPEQIESWLKDLEGYKKSEATVSGVKKEKIQVGLAQAFLDLKKKGYPIVSISSDLPGSTGMGAFRKAHPESSFDVGIAESNMVSVGAGFAKTGYIPVVDTFAQFGVTKGALPLTMASLSEAPVIGVFSHTGFQDAADGASHQALSYFAMVSSIPNVRAVSLSCSKEAYDLVTEAVKNYKTQMEQGQTPPSTVFFLGRENFPTHYAEGSYTLKEEKLFGDTSVPADSLVLTTGSLVPQALEAQEQQKAQGKNMLVVSKPWLNGAFSNEFSKWLAHAQGHLVVLEDHQKISGFGSYALTKITEQFGVGAVKSFDHFAVNGKFGRSAYTAQELYKAHGLTLG